MTPSLEIGNGNWAVKSDSLLGYKTIDGKYYPREIGVTRATTATRINADGLVELTPYNLLTWSEEFDNAAWNRIALGLVSNDATAPNGTLTADKITPDTTTAQHQIRQLSFSYNALTSYTYSVYFKPNGYNAIVMRMAGATAFGTSFGIVVKFDASTMVTTIIDGAPTTTFTSVGNGWYRCSITATTVAAQSAQAIPIYPNNWDPYAGDGTSGIYIWGAQLVEGTEPLDYLPTTDRLDIARIDYSTGEAALLVEPQRTNQYTKSEDFNGWSSKTLVTTTADYSISPSGILNADRLQFTGSGFLHNAIAQVSATQYTVSCYAKRNDSGTQSVGFFVNGTGTVDSAWSLTNEWQRFTYTYTASNSSQTGIAGLVGADVSVFGFQREVGSNATSYIPTTSASVTRNQDVISKTGISDLIGQSEGTVFVEFFYKNNFTELLNIQNTTSSFLMRTRIGQVGTNILSTIYANGGSFPLHPNYTLTPNSINKICIVYNYANKTTKLFANGVFVGSTVGTNAYPTTLQDRIGLGNFAGDSTESRFNIFNVFKTQLTDAECIALTTL